MSGTRSFWGWGLEGRGPSPDHERGIARALAERFGRPVPTPVPPPRIEEIRLPPPRIEVPSALREIVTFDPRERASHTYGKSFRDLVRAVHRDFSPAPDAVALPRNEAEVAALLDWCSEAGICAIPFGGGSSVVGGVERPTGKGEGSALSIDLRCLGAVLEIDRRSRAARIQAGIFGPALEDRLRPEGLTLRHFPQSFEFSTLGGWIATRSGGHYATLYTHIDDFVESLRVVAPAGVVETRRLPGSGAGPSPDRLFIGSEGILGVITEAWMRLQDRPRFRASASVRFGGEAGFLAGAEAVRALGMSGLFPSNCRLLDATEAATSGAGDGRSAVLVLGFESADHPVDAWMARALELCRDHGGIAPEPPAPARGRPSAERDARDAAAGAWRRAFLEAPYLRNALVRMAVISETFETAITWDRFPGFHQAVMEATRAAVARVCGAGSVACRFTHVYPDGPAPYYTVLAPGTPGSELAQWAEIKRAASETLLAHGGTITHHHAVGRDHRPWYDRQRPALFAAALRAAKRSLDPAGVLNPGVLLDP